MKQDGRGVGLEMLELYDMEKDSDTCRYVMDNENILSDLIGVRKIRDFVLDEDDGAMAVDDENSTTCELK